MSEFLNGLLRGFRDVWASAASMLDSMVPAVPAPLAGACSAVADAVAWMQPVLSFFPVGALVASLGIVLAGVVAGMAILITRVGVSVATLGGGAV